jgi:hypothetical protein
MNYFRAVWNWISGIFARAIPAVIDTPKPRAPRRTRPVIDRASWGMFFSLGDVLDELRDYFVCIRRLKRTDKDAYALFSQIGAQIVPSDALAAGCELETIWCDPSFARPAFGMVFFTCFKVDTPNLLHFRMIYFQKISPRKKHEVEIKNIPGDTYVCCGFLTEKHKQWGAVLRFHVHVDMQGCITLLREKQMIDVANTYGRRTIQNGYSKSYRTKEHFQVRAYSWDFPAGLALGLEDHKANGKNLIFKTMQEYAAFLFSFAANIHTTSATGARVAIRSSGGLTAVLNIDPTATPGFFKDRDKIVTVSGRARPIFHSVMPHLRRTARGEKFVKFHFRGLRKFEWNGYRIDITVPGWDQIRDIREFDASAVIYDNDELAPLDAIGMIELGSRLGKTLDASATIH